MASDTSLVFNLVARDRVSQALAPVAAKLNSFGTKIGTAVAGVGVAAPYVAAAAAAAGALAVGAVAAGAAVGAFKLAAGPQLASATAAWGLYDAAQQAASQGGKQAAAANKAYADALAAMTPATRDTARQFVGLKSDFGAWSDSMSGATMPIFTRGIQGLRAGLPALTPLVKAASGALGGFVDSLAKGLGSGGFKQSIASIAGVAGPALSDFLTTVKNVASGFGALLGGLFTQFIPVSKGMTGGLVSMSAAFSAWAHGVDMTSGFAKFMDLARSGKGALGNLASALGQLVVSLAPFLGATTIIAQALANFIAVIPTPVITILAKAFIAASIGMRAWALGTAVWSGVQRAATVAQWAFNTAIAMSPVTWIIIGIVALVAVIVVIATRTNWFQRLWRTAWGAITGAAKSTWNWIKKNWPMILAILTGPIGLAVLFVVKKWDSIVGFFSKLPGRIGRASAGLFDGVKDAFRSAINFVIGGWNSLQFGVPSIDTHIPGVGKVGGGSFGVPQIPYLAKGGHILGSGWAMVGENGPEALHLGAGATVAPLTRGGAGGGVMVRFDFTGADAEFKRAIRKIVRVDGRGDVQIAFGTG